MDVYGAVRTRQSVRRFTDQPVPRDTLERVLTAAGNAPSGSNIQPWHVYVLTGARLVELKTLVSKRVVTGEMTDMRMLRRLAIARARRRGLIRRYFSNAKLGERRYGAPGIVRDDAPQRVRVRAENWNCFGAGTALFCYLDRDMPSP